MMKNIEELITRAAKADKSEDAMRFSQAALNAANAALANLTYSLNSGGKK